MKKRILTLIMCAVMCASVVLSGCGGCNGDDSTGKKPEALVIMSESLDGIFNPFYSTTAPDATIVSMTQLSMITTGYENGNVVVACGDDEAVVVKDYSIVRNEENDTTVYTFVIKNGIKYSDGHPLTMEDVLFNMYVYLDPAYIGSSTMYSTDIVGLGLYRYGSDQEDIADIISDAANVRAKNRVMELVSLFRNVGKTPTEGSYSANYDKMIAAIGEASLSPAYKEAVSVNPDSVTTAQLKADYEHALELFRDELNTDYTSAYDTYAEEPYSKRAEFADEVTRFMYAEGYVTLEYAKDPVTNKDIRTEITKVTKNYNDSVVKDKASAIDYVYNAKIEQELDQILLYWVTAQNLMTEFTAQAQSVIINEMQTGDSKVENISGIVSLGHTTDTANVQIGNNTYTVAHEHNEDGTPKNANEYDVLQITINGVDPKAIWNFAFSVAPQHYYAEGIEVDIANNKFGVVKNDYEGFMKGKIQSERNLQVPMGAGPYVATNAQNGDSPKGSEFFSGNVVFFKANENFIMGKPNIDKLRYQVVSATNAIGQLEGGKVHFISPQYTQYNIEKLNGLKDTMGVKTVSTDQLGYGYIGVNAGKVPSVYLRRAIMSAMNTSLALSYYSAGTAENIYWPMSTVSWAYPKTADGKFDRDNLHDYPAVNFNKESAKAAILNYMEQAQVSAGDSSLKLTFTIAGSNLTDHPTYLTFQNAADLLNECGWDVEIKADPLALTKLSTGSLAVWAAAWGTTVDPDMYQVYHKDSTATSTLAWGYREIKASPDKYSYENAILAELSDVIDSARETEDRAERTALYKTAMGYVLDLAIELPVYQRDVLYAYNSKVLDASTLPSEINPYTSPLDHIWELKFAE